MKKYFIWLVVTIQIAGTNCNKDKLEEKLPGEKKRVVATMLVMCNSL